MQRRPFDQPFYIVMNLAVGGPGTPYTGNQTPADGTYTMQIADVEAFSVPILGDVNRDWHSMLAISLTCRVLLPTRRRSPRSTA